jgi:hypothetical protein
MQVINGQIFDWLIYLAIGILSVLHGIRGKPWAGQPEVPPTKEETEKAKPLGRLERIVSILAGMFLGAYAVYRLLRAGPR